MRLRPLLLLLLALLPLTPVAAHAAPTPTEAAAIAAAESDHTAYTLPPDKLTKAQHLGTFRTVAHFGGALWGIVSLLLVLHSLTATTVERAVTEGLLTRLPGSDRRAALTAPTRSLLRL